MASIILSFISMILSTFVAIAVTHYRKTDDRDLLDSLYSIHKDMVSIKYNNKELKLDEKDQEKIVNTLQDILSKSGEKIDLNIEKVVIEDSVPNKEEKKDGIEKKKRTVDQSGELPK